MAVTSDVSSQSFPVQANIFIQPPYSPYLNDYVAPGSDKIRVNLFFKDLASPELQVKLRFRIEGVGITIQGRQNYNPPPIGLSGGIPLILTSDDLVEYFQPRNLDIAGISRAQFERGTRLPDGVYRFTVEVYDYNRNTLISNRGTTMAWIVLNDPPMLNLPRNGEKVRITDPQNIVFSWTPRHTGSPNSAFTTEYTFRIVELWDDRNPFNALQSQQPLVEIASTFPQIVYSMSEPALIPGRKYAWMVIARDVNGLDLFKNQGMSEAGIFQFGDALLTPENLHLQSAGPSRLTVRWDQSLAGWEPASYRVRYRPRHNRTIDEWYEATSLDQWRAITSLQPDTEYEVQVRAEQPAQKSEYTPIAAFKTLVQEENEFECKDNTSMPVIIPRDNKNPPFMLSVNDTLHIADGHDIVVRQLRSGSLPNTYTGTGVAIVRFMNSIKLKVKFENIAVNENFWVLNGMIETISDLDGEVPEDEVQQPDSVQSTSGGPGIDSVSTVPAITYEIEGVIDSVYVSETGQIVVVREDGSEETFEQPMDSVSEEKMPVAITDNLGNQIVVDKDGKITKQPSDKATPIASQSISNLLSNEKLKGLIIEVLSEFEQEINDWLSNNEKGPLDEWDIISLQELSDCLPKNVDRLEEVQAIIDEYKNNPEAILDSILQNAANKEFIEAQLPNINGPEPYKQYFTEDGWKTFKEMTCAYLYRLQEERIDYEGFVVTVQADTVRMNDIYIVGESKTEFKLAFYSKNSDIGEIKFKMLIKEEGTTIETSYPSQDWEKGERNKVWIIPLETAPEGKYIIKYKVDNSEEVAIEFWIRHKHYDFACKVCGRDLQITHDKLKTLFENSSTIESNPITVDYFKLAIEKAQINTCYRQAHFFSQIDHESNGMQAKVEGTNYDMHGLLTTWNQNTHSKDVFYKQSFWSEESYLDYASIKLLKKDSLSTSVKYKSTKTSAYKWNNQNAFKIEITNYEDFDQDTSGIHIRKVLTSAQKTENGTRLLNLVYAAPVGTGNGDEASGDGYKYRGRGAIMLTGKGNYKAVSDKCNEAFGTTYDWESNPDEVKNDLKAMILSASAFIMYRLGNIDQLDTVCSSDNTYDGCVRPITRLVNGRYIGLDDRKKRFKILIEGMLNNCKTKK